MDIRVCDDGVFDSVLELVKKEKVGLEFQTFHDPFLKNMKKIISYQRDASARIKHKSLHAPFWELNVGTKMPGLRRETMKYFNFAYNTAHELGCDVIVVHNGYIPGTYGYSGWVRRASEFWTEFFANKDKSITVMIENQFETTSELMKMVVDTVNDKRLKICLDVGHANCNSNMSVYDWIKTLGPRIGYMHLHNNHGRNQQSANSDEHNGFFDGTIDMKKVVKLVQQHCPRAIMAIETRLADAPEAISFLKKYTR